MYGLGVVLACGLIPEWGRWYSASLAYRRQVEALMRGSLSLSSDPADLGMDLAWAQGGVHQVWGLGVPLWRLPFEAAARLVSDRPFPDMLAFVVALAVAAGLLFGALEEAWRCGMAEEGGASAAKNRRSWVYVLWLIGAGLVCLFLPPFLTLLQSRFAVYEEAVAYEYVYGIGLIAGLIRMAGRPTRRRFGLLCLAAGFGGLIRPTLVLHGFGVVAAGLTVSRYPRREAGRRWVRMAVLGAALFCVGNGMLYVTNLARFGSGFEFGHRLNVRPQGGTVYATRFDDPYADEPLLSAARELFGLLFLTHDFNVPHFYQQRLFPGQSETVRWREVYLTTYDLSYAGWLAAGWLVALGAGWRWLAAGVQAKRGDCEPPSWVRMVAVLGWYSMSTSVLLAGFYLRNCVVSSRYSLDFMPCFAAGMLAAWTAWMLWWRKRGAGGGGMAVSLLVLLIWLHSEIGRGRAAYGSPDIVSWSQVARRMTWKPAKVCIPSGGAYESCTDPQATGISANGTGWLSPGGDVGPCVILFVEDPELLELDVALGPGANVEEGPVAWRAKVGLEFLERERMERTPEGWRLVFAGPHQKQYQRGLQPVFLATVPKEQLAEPHSPWRLLRVRWRYETPSTPRQAR